MMIFPLLGSGMPQLVPIRKLRNPVRSQWLQGISNLPQMFQLMPQNSSPQKKQWNVYRSNVCLKSTPHPVKVANEGLQGFATKNAVLLLVTGILHGG